MYCEPKTKKMDEKSEVEKIDEVMLPGFRFHPTDEELVGFYLKRKIQQRTLSIELIKQLDIYKYDPWDLPKMATTGEKEWYFYCPRDRKYRNSARPNRVTGAGFWKATGTDRPIYSSEGNKCIGLKKSLVFYKGRAAKGIKTDWMMHEFRLPSLTDSGPPKRFIDKTIPANESWAICRIFKKTSSTTLRVTSHSWVSTLPEPVSSNHIPSKCCQATHLNSQSMIMTTENSSGMHLNYNNDHIEQTSTVNPLDFSYHKPINPFPWKPSQLPISNCDLTNNFLLSPLETSAPAKCTVDFSSILLNMSSSMLGDYGKVGESIGLDDSQEHCNNGFSLDILPQEMQLSMSNGDETVSLKSSNMAHMDSEWEIARNIGFPFSSQMNMTNIGAWKPNLIWDSLPFPTEVSASFSRAKCYT
ncbi:hypothetical protein K2173_006341 [Erythroxylum novogranatense]|uniref:NAC domain-containing protein n=1 Tax=Erythroxylum novogranatense TaxID=1862640 RepID=A0AAV8U333_9ROSI|nr:hypothetical protein K2173_006341 [Erythroxylum novogranatense]